MTKIYKASAGSGKTFTLSKIYSERLLNSTEEHPYRHILAVTFTNKATAQMKEKILRDLRDLAEKGDKRARKLLIGILNDYSSFAVSTIDKFFQRTLKAFSREVGYFASYQIELDRDSLVAEAMDRILDSLTEDKKDLVEWVNRSVAENLEKGNKFSMDSALYEMGRQLKSEQHRKLSETYGIDESRAYAKERLTAIKKECHRAIKDYVQAVTDNAEDILKRLSDAGLDPYRTSRKWLAAVEKFTDPEYVGKGNAPTAGFFKNAADSDTWMNKADKDLTGAYVSAVGARLEHFVSLMGDSLERRTFNSAVLILKDIFSLGLAGEFYREFDELLKEKNIMCLDESNVVLRDIIDGTDAPFIYEKIGVRFKDFLLDEFQDTSNIQWDNFKPLLAEGQSQGGFNLIVGDVKQSIYRFRDSDWNLLATKVTEDLRDVDVITMENNWRCSKAVLDFNNAFFEDAAERVGSLAPEDTGLPITDLYDSLFQNKKSSETQEGSVNVRFCEDQLGLVLETIKDAFERGARPYDIAVLVRGKDEGSAIADFLIANGLNVMSDDSLRLKSSLAVRRLVSLLASMDNPEDSVNSYLAKSLGIEYPDRYNSLTDLCEALIRGLGVKCNLEHEALFIQAFMDDLQDWVNVNGNNLRYFLKQWDEKDKCISTPGNADAVRILTIHKSKGLEYPLVIFPFANKVTLFHPDRRWCHIETEGSGLDKCMEGIYPVTIYKSTEATLFRKDYLDEAKKQLVENLNLTYVAFTRAKKELYVFSEPCKGNAQSMADILHDYIGVDEYHSGVPYDYTLMDRKDEETCETVSSGYPSIPAGDRFRPSREASDFFGEDGVTGPDASERRHGIILHGILERVRVADDLRKAVDNAVKSGQITEAQGNDYFNELNRRIGEHPEWFDADAEVLNETEILSAEGFVQRPDRVVIKDWEVNVIDYKFGEAHDYYKRQVGRYMDLYRELGYASVRGFVWYVSEGRVSEV